MVSCGPVMDQYHVQCVRLSSLQRAGTEYENLDFWIVDVSHRKPGPERFHSSII